MQEARERLKKTRSLCVACCLLGMFRSRQCRLPAMFLHFQVEIKHIIWQPCFTCPLKHAAGGVICQGASMLPTSYWHGCRLQLLFQTVLPTYKLQLVFLSVSCRLLSRNSVQTSKDMSLEPVEFFRHICFLSAWKNLTFYQYRQWNSVKLCIRLVGCHPSDSHLAIQPVDYVSDWYVASLLAPKPYLLLFFVLIGLDIIVKTLPRCYLKTYIEELVFSRKQNTDNDTASLWCCSNRGHWKMFRHIIWQTYFTRMSFRTCCWRGHLPGCFNAPHFLLTRVPSSTPFPNSLAYIQIAACLLICVLPSAFKKSCSNKQGHVTGTSSIFQTHLLPERMKESHFYQYRQGNLVKLCRFWVGLRPSYTGAVFNSSGARLRELCQQGGTKLSQGHFLLVWRVMLAHCHWNLVICLCYIVRVIVIYTL